MSICYQLCDVRPHLQVISLGKNVPHRHIEALSNENSLIYESANIFYLSRTLVGSSRRRFASGPQFERARVSEMEMITRSCGSVARWS